VRGGAVAQRREALCRRLQRFHLGERAQFADVDMPRTEYVRDCVHPILGPARRLAQIAAMRPARDELQLGGLDPVIIKDRAQVGVG